MNQVDYSTIPGPSRQCVVCGRDLAPVSKHPSVLEVTEDGQPERRDACPECWEKIADREFFSFWLTHREPPKPDTRRTREEHRAAVMRLFEQMLAGRDQRFRPHLYLLAHTLMKYRLLKWEGTEKSEEGLERIIFRNRATDELIRIEGIDLSDDNLIAAQREIDFTLMAEETEPSDSASEEPGRAQ